jgi:hypothetical protein
MEIKSNPRRLPRYKRAPELFGRFEPTTRDVAILRLVHDYRFLTVDHILALIPGSKRQIARRLQGMYHHSLLARVLPPLRVRDGILSGVLGSPKFAYALDTGGARAICEADGIAASELRWRPEHNGRMHWFIEHHLMVSTFRATLELALAGDQSLDLIGWADEETLRDSVTVRYPDGHRQVHRVCPDGYFAVREHGTLRNFFLEADRGTEEHPRVLTKFQSYWWYLSDGSPYYAKYENAKNRLVLVVCTSEKRMAAMRKTLARVGDGRRSLGQFWFTTTSRYRLTQPESLRASIWFVGPRTYEARNEPDVPRAIFTVP